MQVQRSFIEESFIARRRRPRKLQVGEHSPTVILTKTQESASDAWRRVL